MPKHNEQSLKDVIRLILRDDKMKAKYYQAVAQSVWEKKMGTTINQYTTEVTLRRNILYIKMTSASLKQELLYSKDKILMMMNTEIGEDFISQVILL